MVFLCDLLFARLPRLDWSGERGLWRKIFGHAWRNLACPWLYSRVSTARFTSLPTVGDNSFQARRSGLAEGLMDFTLHLRYLSLPNRSDFLIRYFGEVFVALAYRFSDAFQWIFASAYQLGGLAGRTGAVGWASLAMNTAPFPTASPIVFFPPTLIRHTSGRGHGNEAGKKPF